MRLKPCSVHLRRKELRAHERGLSLFHVRCGGVLTVLLRLTFIPRCSYNTALRSRDAAAVQRWQDYSCVFESGLNKLPPVKCTVYRQDSPPPLFWSRTQQHAVHLPLTRFTGP